ncbi:MAG TPA: heme-binding protein [Porticoccus sp.]|nr:heme-binding protein [Porticoccus sp.]
MSRTITQTFINHHLAVTACQAAIAMADELSEKINVAVVDRSGRMVAFLRHADAPFHSSDIAVDKAYTSASFGVPTHQWPEIMSTMSEAVQKGMLLRDRFIAFGGGLPILLGDEMIGAVGVSGASEEQDQMCAEAAVAAINTA